MTAFFPVLYFSLTVFLSGIPAVRFVRPTACGGEWALLHFAKTDKFNPVLMPGKGVFMDPIRKTMVAWESKDVFNPAIIVRSGRIYMLYRAQDRIGQPAGTSRIGLAERPYC